MLSHSQQDRLFVLNKDTTSLFSLVPRDVVDVMRLCCESSPNSEIAQALQYAAYARQTDVNALMAMLDKNPRLLLQAGNVQTPGGMTVRRVSPYECALGAGDPALAEMIGPYFASIPNGEVERLRQRERYRLPIEGIRSQKHDGITSLIERIIQASMPDVIALLNKDMKHESPLRNAIIQFRKDHAPRVLSEPCMHYNYASLQHAFDIFEREWKNLHQASGNNSVKIRLVWLLLSMEMRRLPGVDRCAFAQGLYKVVNSNQPLARSYKYTEEAGEFPVTLTDDSFSAEFTDDESAKELGIDFSIDIGAGAHVGGDWGYYVGANLIESMRSYLDEKISHLENICGLAKSERPAFRFR